MTGNEQAATTAEEVRVWPPATSWMVIFEKEGQIGYVSAYRCGIYLRLTSLCPKRQQTFHGDFEDLALARAEFEETLRKTLANGYRVVYDGPPLAG